MELSVKTASLRRCAADDTRINVYAPYAMEQGMSYEDALALAEERENDSVIQLIASAENGS